MSVFQACVPNGTRVAFIDKLQSLGSTPKISMWGGARNFKFRTSEHLDLEQCRRLIRAFNNSEKLDLPFNRHWTVHYEKAGVSEQNATKFIGRLLKLVREYAGRHKKRFACIWVREGGVAYGNHVHILMHLDPELSLRGRTRKWIRVAGGISKRNVSEVRSVGGSLIGVAQHSKHHEVNRHAVLSYLLKCANGEAGRELGLTRYGVTAKVTGKRCGYSQNLGRTSDRTIAV